MSSAAANSPVLANLAVFMGELRAAGIPVALDQEMDFLRALELVAIGDRDQVFHAARSTLINRREHLRLFETLFNAFFARPASADDRHKPRKAPVAPRHQPRERPFDVTTYMAYKARGADQEIDLTDRVRTFSATEVLQRKDFSQMTPEEIERLKRLMQAMTWRFSLRESRRRVRQRRGEWIHLRDTLRIAARHGGTPVRLARQTRKIKRRPIILIADISGSMEKYARVLLLFFHCVAQRMRDVHSFVFGTRLSCITPQLRIRNVDRAIDEAGRDVLDWSGGTRIGESLRTFNRRWARRVLRRGAITIIISDGWERGDVSVLRSEMRFLQHRCHRVIWLNPLSAAERYLPLVEGMQAALPFINHFLPIHNLESLQEVNRRLATL